MLGPVVQNTFAVLEAERDEEGDFIPELESSDDEAPDSDEPIELGDLVETLQKFARLVKPRGRFAGKARQREVARGVKTIANATFDAAIAEHEE